MSGAGGSMTSRERLMAAIRHQIPDRVPVSTYEMTGWHFDPREENQQEFNRSPTRMYLSGWWNAEPSYQPLMEYIRQNADCVYMTDVQTGNRYVKEHSETEYWRRENSQYTRYTLHTPKGPLSQTFRVDDGVYTAWETEHFIKTGEDVERYLSIPFDPEPVSTSHLQAQDAYIGDNGILMVDVLDPICEVAGLFDFSDFTVTAFTEPEIITRLLDFTYERQAHFLREMLEKGAGPLFRFAGPEYCTPPYLPKECFCNFVTRYDKRLIRMIHDHGQYVRVHSHGKIRTVIDQFLEMEVDAIDPVESPEEQDGDLHLWEAKEMTQGKICLFGNIQLKDLEQLPADRMREKVKRCVEEGKSGCNFVVLPTATPLNAQISSRTEENFRIMIDTVLEYGRY